MWSFVCVKEVVWNVCWCCWCFGWMVCFCVSVWSVCCCCCFLLKEMVCFWVLCYFVGCGRVGVVWWIVWWLLLLFWWRREVFLVMIGVEICSCWRVLGMLFLCWSIRVCCCCNYKFGLLWIMWIWMLWRIFWLWMMLIIFGWKWGRKCVGI